MAQDPRQQYAQMLSALPPTALDGLKRQIRRRLGLFAAGSVVVIVGAFLTLQPPFLSTLVMLGGAALALLGMLGLARGTGCMAYVAGFFWLSAMTCGVAKGNEASLYVLAGTAAAFALAALFIPKPKAQNPLEQFAKMMQGGGMPGGMPGAPGAPGGFPFGPPGFGQPPNNALGNQVPARERVIDVNAEERPAPSSKKKRK